MCVRVTRECEIDRETEIGAHRERAREKWPSRVRDRVIGRERDR